MSLRAKLTLTVAAIVAVAVFGGAYAAHVSAGNALRDETDKFLQQRAAEFVARPPSTGFGGAGPSPTSTPPSPSTPSITVVPTATTSQVDHEQHEDDEGPGRYFDYDAVQQRVGADGSVTQLVSTQPKLPVDGEDSSIATSGTGSHYRDVTVATVQYRMITEGLGTGNGAVQIARRVSETHDILDVLRERLLLIALAGVGVAAIVAWLVGRRLTKPIRTLTRTAEHIAQTQDLTTPIPVKGDDDVGRLAASFNTMLVALDTSRQQQQRLIMDASHELRTPLTAVRTNIDFLAHATTLGAEERAQLIDETRLELDELTNLVSEMVELATDVRNEEPIDTVDLGELAGEVAQRFRRRTGREIEVDTEAAGAVEGRRSMLDRAVSNLVDNALKFSPAGEPVEITVRGARIEVADRGPGVADEDRTRVFDRFYRATGARTLPGSGLGLSIVAQIAQLHGGRATLEPRDGGGTVAIVDLTPVAARAARAPRPS
jgi:two-component system sensor histidine kinase MprB